MDLKRLELFCKVVDEKNFTRAADASGLSQPSVSEHIRCLEEEVGERLLDRLGREVLPTPAGKLLLGYARRMLDLRDQAAQALDEFGGRLCGRLRVGASSIPGNYLLPRAVEEFHQLYPDVQVQIGIGGTGRMLDELLEANVELAVVGDTGHATHVEFQPLFEDELVLAVPDGHPWQQRGRIAPAELAGCRYVQREPGSGSRAVVERALLQAGVDARNFDVVAEFGSNEAIRQALRAGIGVSILSLHSIVEDLERGNLARVELEGISVTRSFYLARRRSRQLSPVAQAFQDFLLGQR